MLKNKDVKSNCKRIAKWIMSHNEVIDGNTIEVPLSKGLMADMMSKTNAYRKRLNRELLLLPWKDEDDECIEYYFTVDDIEIDGSIALFYLLEHTVYTV